MRLYFSKTIQKEMITLIKEYKFHPIRKWRFDYANVELKIAIECEGGVYTNGRHTRGNGFVNDMEKYNTATAMGWRLIRVTPQQFAKFEHLKYIKMILENTQ
jgi:very-short-patch-repair endonuclease